MIMRAVQECVATGYYPLDLCCRQFENAAATVYPDIHPGLTCLLLSRYGDQPVDILKGAGSRQFQRMKEPILEIRQAVLATYPGAPGQMQHRRDMADVQPFLFAPACALLLINRHQQIVPVAEPQRAREV